MKLSIIYLRRAESAAQIVHLATVAILERCYRDIGSLTFLLHRCLGDAPGTRKGDVRNIRANHVIMYTLT